MSKASFGGIMACSLLLAAGALADDSAAPAQPPSAPVAASATNGGKSMRLYLLEGSVVSGKLSVEAVTVETEFGTLQIPVANIVSFTPGLDNHQDERKRIVRLIQQLGSNAAAERDAAQKSLADMGMQVRAELERFANDEDPERRMRVKKVLAELEERDADEESEDPVAKPAVLIAQDMVETNRFTVVGKISPQTFKMQTQFGMLNVSLSDIRRAVQETDTKVETRKSLAVQGANLVQNNLLNSGIRLNRGDKVSITADGTITMTPWGNNSVSTPEGGENFQWYIQQKIANGALVGRIGANGEVFKIGTKHSFTANRSGTLFLAIAMSSQFATQQFPGKYDVKVKVTPK